MSKIRVYAKSSGNKNAAILVGDLKECPSGHTDIVPLEPKKGFTVDWNESESKWEYNEIPVQEEVAE